MEAQESLTAGQTPPLTHLWKNNRNLDDNSITNQGNEVMSWLLIAV